MVCPVTASVLATGVQNSSHLGASVTFTMPFTFYIQGVLKFKKIIPVPKG